MVNKKACWTEEKLVDFLKESHEIENIFEETVSADILQASAQFLDYDFLTVPLIEKYVRIIQPGAFLRERRGDNVEVYGYGPPRGGPYIKPALEKILARANKKDNPWEVHCSYEALHPWMDGNGRSGRMIWAWQVVNQDIWPHLDDKFLKTFYFHTLEKMQKK